MLVGSYGGILFVDANVCACVSWCCVITGLHRNNVAYSAMTATSPAAYLWFVVAIVFGNYILLNLFLAILLENFSSSTGSFSTNGSSTTSSTIAAAARVACVLAWLQGLMEGSWMAKLAKRRHNRVHAAAAQAHTEADEKALVAETGSAIPGAWGAPGVPADALVAVARLMPALPVKEGATLPVAVSPAGIALVAGEPGNRQQGSPRDKAVLLPDSIKQPSGLGLAGSSAAPAKSESSFTARRWAC